MRCIQEVRKVVWHQKGDYFASVAVADIAASVYIHQLSKAKSQVYLYSKLELLARGREAATRFVVLGASLRLAFSSYFESFPSIIHIMIRLMCSKL